MAISQVPPLSSNVPIVYPPGHPSAGCPTPAFATLMQILLDEKAVTDALAEGAIQPGTVTTSGLTAAAQRLLGNKEATTGAIEELTVTEALDLIAGTAAQGDIFYRGATSVKRLPAGTSGQFLKTLGAGADPAWGTVSSGSGALVLLSSQTAAASASLTFTSLISATYDEYVIELIDVAPATNAASLQLQFSTDNGANYSATGYQYAAQQSNSAGTTSGVASSSATAIVAISSLSNLSGWAASGTIKLFAPGSANRKQALIDMMGLKSDANWYRDLRGGLWNNTAAYNAFRLIMSSGNIASGTVRLYGVAH